MALMEAEERKELLVIKVSVGFLDNRGHQDSPGLKVTKEKQAPQETRVEQVNPEIVVLQVTVVSLGGKEQKEVKEIRERMVPKEIKDGVDTKDREEFLEHVVCKVITEMMGYQESQVLRARLDPQVDLAQMAMLETQDHQESQVPEVT